tara:strand:+ start:17106 stop:19076 length:1971 start_codon:yes stop_codon:yes gene_type:complete
MKIIFLLIFFIIQNLSFSQGKELYRPQFHYTPAENWMNDPNGLVYYEGEYHLFYQHNPFGNDWGYMSWGHAVSRNLINWTELPVALPFENDGNIHMFSGSTVVDWNNSSGFGNGIKPPLIAFYTASYGKQDQRIAYSNDNGRTWTKYEGNPVINIDSDSFRDPKVIWHKESKKWIMVVALSNDSQIRFYSSKNLVNWTFMQDFGPLGIEGIWECSDFFPLSIDNDSNTKKWVLAISEGTNKIIQGFTGNFDGNKFTPDTDLKTQKKQSSKNLVFIDDFESGNYNNWTVTGDAFGAAPSSGTFKKQSRVNGYLGNYLMNSYIDGDAPKGKMASAPFQIENNYISLLIAGGKHPTGTYAKLIVDDNVIYTATGKNSEWLDWENWNVSNYIGQTATIEVVDSISGDWGHINVDHIYQSNNMQKTFSNDFFLVDYGKDYYAAQSYSDIPEVDGRRISIGWMFNFDYSPPTFPWRGVMTIPREIELKRIDGVVTVLQHPVDELQLLRKRNTHFSNQSLSSIKTAFDAISLPLVEVKAEIQINGASKLGFKFNKGKGEETIYTYDVNNNNLLMDRSNSGHIINSAFAEVRDAPLEVKNGKILLHFFIDKSSIELFANNGTIVMTNQVYPSETSNGMEIFYQGGNPQIIEMNIWELQPYSNIK